MSDFATETNPIFLLGAQRSGTTALGCALSAAAAATGGIFTVNGKLPYYLRRWWLDEPSHRHSRADEILHSLHRRRPLGEGIEGWLRKTELALQESAHRIAQYGEKIEPWGEMRRICHEAYAGAVLWGDKYNEYLLELPFLDRLFPKAIWIYLVRQPTEVISSMLDWTGDRPWKPEGVEACALKWAAWNKHWLDFRCLITSERRIELCYDYLIDYEYTELDAVFGTRLRSYLINYRPRFRHSLTSLDLPDSVNETWLTIQKLFENH